MFMASIHWMQAAAILDSGKLLPRLLLTIANLLNCPCGMLRDQWLRVCCRVFERRKVRYIAHISERDAHIA